MSRVRDNGVSRTNGLSILWNMVMADNKRYKINTNN